MLGKYCGQTPYHYFPSPFLFSKNIYYCPLSKKGTGLGRFTLGLIHHGCYILTQEEDLVIIRTANI